MGILNGPSNGVAGGGNISTQVSTSVNTPGLANPRTNYTYICTAVLTFTLPTAIGNTGVYTIKNTSAGIVTLSTTSAQTIDGSAPGTIAAGGCLEVFSNNSNWLIQSKYL